MYVCSMHYVCIYSYMHDVCMYVCLCIYVCIYVYMYVCVCVSAMRVKHMNIFSQNFSRCRLADIGCDWFLIFFFLLHLFCFIHWPFPMGGRVVNTSMLFHLLADNWVTIFLSCVCYNPYSCQLYVMHSLPTFFLIIILVG